jgi:hypothetical protein
VHVSLQLDLNGIKRNYFNFSFRPPISVSGRPIDTKLGINLGWHSRRYNIQHNDIQHNDTKHNDTQHNDTKHNDTQLNDTQHNDT